MDKTGQVEVGVTPCAVCGRPSEALCKGEAYCMSCYLKKQYKRPPMVTKLAKDHTVKE